MRSSRPAQSLYDDQSWATGFQYLETRDGTQLSINVVLPGPARGRALPHRRRVQRLRPLQPRRRAGRGARRRHRSRRRCAAQLPILCKAPAEPASLIAGLMGLRRRRRERARHRVLRRRVRLLRDDAGARRLRRDRDRGGPGLGAGPPGRHGRPLLPRALRSCSWRSPDRRASAPSPRSRCSATRARACSGPAGSSTPGSRCPGPTRCSPTPNRPARRGCASVIEEGDTACADNQRLRLQNVDVVQKALDHPYYTDEVAGPLDIRRVRRRDRRRRVPRVGVAGRADRAVLRRPPRPLRSALRSPASPSTTGSTPTASPRRSSRSGRPSSTSTSPTPSPTSHPWSAPSRRSSASEIFGGAVPLPPDRWGGVATADGARAKFEAEPPAAGPLRERRRCRSRPPRVDLRADRRRSGPTPGCRPPAGSSTPTGTLAPTAPPAAAPRWRIAPDPIGGRSHVLDREQLRHLEGDPLRSTGTPPHPVPEAAFETAPLTEPMTMLGTGSVDLWVRSTAADADLEVVLSEVRPDGKEVLVQTGRLRASYRALERSSTDAPSDPARTASATIAPAPGRAVDQGARADPRLRPRRSVPVRGCAWRSTPPAATRPPGPTSCSTSCRHAAPGGHGSRGHGRRPPTSSVALPLRPWAGRPWPRSPRARRCAASPAVPRRPSPTPSCPRPETPELASRRTRRRTGGIAWASPTSRGSCGCTGQERPDQVAIVFGEREVTWRELDERSSRLANALVAAGVQANDRIARIEKNGPDYFELAFAASKVNAVLVDVNWRLAPAEMRQIIDDAARQGALRRRGVRTPPRQDRVGAGHRRAHGPPRLGRRHPRVDRDVRRRRSRPTDPGVEGTPQDICLQLYTSGTTGLPKGVMLSNENLFSFIDEVPKDVGLHAGVRVARRDAHVPHRRLRLGARQPRHGVADDPRPRGGPGADPAGGGGARDHPRDLRAGRAPVPADRAQRPRPRPVVDAARRLRRVPDHRAGAARRDGAVLHRQVRAGVRAHRDHRRGRAARRRRPRPGEPARAPPLRRQAVPVDRAPRRRRRRRRTWPRARSARSGSRACR